MNALHISGERTHTAPGWDDGRFFPESAAEVLARVGALKNGLGLKYILDGASDILKNPLLIFDAEYRLLVRTGHAETDDWVWNELVTTGALSDASIRFLRDECFLDEFSNVRTVALIASDNMKYNRLLGKILNQDGIAVARLMMPAVNKPIGALDSVAFEAVCGRCTKEASGMPVLLDYGHRYQQMLIYTLLSRRRLERSLYAVHAGSLYAGLESYLFVAVAGAPRGTGAAGLLRLREQLRRLEPGCKYAIYKGRLVIIMSSSESGLTARRDMVRLKRFLQQKNMRAGVSRRFENIFELRRHYADALGALRSIRDGGERISLCGGDEQRGK